MSEKIRMAAGIALLAVCLALLASSVFSRQSAQAIRYRSGRIPLGRIEAIEPETGGTVRVNDADKEELTGLYGIGDTLAALIVQERTENGPFFYAADLTAVKGIGPKTLEKFRNMIDLTEMESGE